MRITVNAEPMTGLLTGINRYLRNLYQAILSEQTLETHFLLPELSQLTLPAAGDSHLWQKKTARIRKIPDALLCALRSGRWLYYENRLRAQLRRLQPALHHETAFTPAAIDHLVPQVFTLHDLSLRHWRSMHPRERIWYADIFFARRLQEADHIITPSQFIRQELNQSFKIPLARITAIAEAADPIFRVLPEPEVQAVLNRLQLPAEYLLFVGSLEPRKNIVTLIQALSQVRSDIPLVLTGWSGWGAKPWLKSLQEYRLSHRVLTTGHVSDDDLVALYNGATIMIYPSLYEGFGLPVIEAMACGCPVITSDRASLPEVAGSAATLLAEPTSADELSFAIDKLLDDSSLRQKFSAQGLVQAASFSWAQTARETISVFRDVAGV